MYESTIDIVIYITYLLGLGVELGVALLQIGQQYSNQNK